jgi:hypothetical protein
MDGLVGWGIGDRGQSVTILMAWHEVHEEQYDFRFLLLEFDVPVIVLFDHPTSAWFLVDGQVSTKGIPLTRI